MDMTSKQVSAVLEHWPLTKTHVTLTAHRENTVFRVDTADGKSYALRLRRAGYRSDAEIESELDWMAMLAHEGLHVPMPVTTIEGSRVVREGELCADMVTWLEGRSLGKSGEPLELGNAVTTFKTLGRTAARIHLLSDQWTLPAGFERPRWDVDALLGDAPLWGRFWDCEGLTSSDAALFDQFREAASVALTNVHESLDMGLIHADLVRENILLDPCNPNTVAVIDFDDGVIGYRLFEIATALGKNIDEPQYLALREALIDGYRELRPIDTSYLDLFMAIRAATYVGWSAARKSEHGGKARAARAVDATRVAVTHWLV
jgi:Ser/Thr protein kinase RdoA (MazF antagonist)